MKKAKLFILITLILSINLIAQVQDWKWAKSTGSTSDEESNNVAVDPSGNIYITGSFQSPTITFGSYPLTNNGGNDIFIAKCLLKNNFRILHLIVT